MTARGWTTFSCAVAVVALGLLTPVHAEPQDPAVAYAPGLADGETQASLKLGDDLEAAVQSIRGINDGAGYGAIATDVDARVLTVLWKAPLPPAVQDLDGVTVFGFRVEVKESDYSQHELLAESEKLLKAAAAGEVLPISSITGEPDGSGLLVEVLASALSKSSALSVANELGAVASMPLRVEAGAGPDPTSRQDDSNPWYGGGMMFHPDFHPALGDFDPFIFCSNAFAVVTATDQGRLLSARHCNESGNLAWDDGHSDPLTLGGPDVDRNADDDNLIIDPIGGTDGWVHGGPWNATSSHPRYHLKVAGSATAVHNEEVCTSGANSGEHCGLRVQDVFMRTWTCGPGICHGWTARGLEPVVTAVSVGGDSGGPVYHNRADGRVGARGVIHGGTAPEDCGNIRIDVTNCYGTVWFTDITRVINHWVVTVETTP